MGERRKNEGKKKERREKEKKKTKKKEKVPLLAMHPVHFMQKLKRVFQWEVH